MLLGVDLWRCFGKAGAKPGDKIVKLNDVEVESIDEIKNFLQENKNQPVKVTV